MFQNYSAKAMRMIMYARIEAGAHGAIAIEPEHVLLGLLRADMDLINRFYSSSASLVPFLALIESHATVREQMPMSVELPLSAESERVLRHADEAASGLASRSRASTSCSGYWAKRIARQRECFAHAAWRAHSFVEICREVMPPLEKAGNRSARGQCGAVSVLRGRRQRCCSRE